MLAYVVVHLAPTRGIQRARGEHAILTRHDVKRLLAEYDAKLTAPPVPEGARSDLSASATFVVVDMARAEKLAAALRGMVGIETAYAKPGEELP